MINCINIYSPLDIGSKKEAWEEIGKILLDFENEPCCVVGDFNSILSDDERSNCMYRRVDSKLFELFVKDYDL